VSHGTRSVAESEHAAPDEDERAGSEEVRDELDGAGPAEHRQPVQSDSESGNGRTEARALERWSEEGEKTQDHRAFYRRDPDYRDCPWLTEYPTDLDQRPFPALRREAFRLGQASKQEGGHASC
jgi:hypothetical protein